MAEAQNRQAIVRREQSKKLLDFIGTRRPHIEKAMSALAKQMLPPDRILDLLNVALTRQPKLLECTEQSIFFSIQQAC